MTDKDKVTIILPTLNEEKAIGPVIDELHQNGYNNIIVIDGHSTDKTKEISQQKKAEFHEQEGKGKADAIKSVLKYIQTPYLLIMDCDYTYDAADIEKFLVEIQKANQVIGARDLKSDAIPKFNQFGNALITKTYNLVMGTKIDDICCGMYMFKTDFLKKLDFQLKGYQIEFDLASQAGEYGKISQVPINYRKRLGETKMSPIKEGINVFKVLYNFCKVYNPTLIFAVFAGLLVFPGLILLGYDGVKWLINPADYRSGIAQIALVLIVMGSTAIVFALISSHLRRIERKINNLAWNLNHSKD